MPPAARRAQPFETRRVLADGAEVRIGDDAVEVRDREGRLLVRYRDGHAEIAAPAGDLVLTAPAGEVVVHGASGVRIESSGEIALAGREAKVSASAVRIVAGELVQSLTSFALRAERYEVVAGELLERAEDALREVRGRLMTKAERLRQIVTGAAIHTAERTEIRSERETAIDGERVLLG